MTQETYRFAYDEANAELREIIEQFKQLQDRKEQIEQVVEALRAVMEGPSIETIAASTSDAAPFLVSQSVEAAAEPTPEAAPVAMQESKVEPEPVFAEQSTDPFQRRIDNALRHGLGSRESRVLPRGLSGLLSRA